MQKLTPDALAVDPAVIAEKIHRFLKGGDILFIMPPFSSIDDITLGPHNLQVLARKKGFKTDILYLNILLASIIGQENYDRIFKGPLYWQIGERLFARAAYGLPPLGRDPQFCHDEGKSIRGIETHLEHIKLFYRTEDSFDLDHYLQIEKICLQFIETVVPILGALNYKIIGCTSTAIGQTNSSIALFNRLKAQFPQTLTIIGGSNCDGRMAGGIDSLSDKIDYIFSGESDKTFQDFLDAYSAGQLPIQRIITGEPIQDLDQIPFPDYDVCIDQYIHFLGKDPTDTIRIWYETSRGCWWAQNAQRCTFCSIHVDCYRQKSVEKVVRELKESKRKYPSKLLFMTDNIMPHTYHKELLPLIMDNDAFPDIGYQLRTDLALTDLERFKRAKINAILPGIEALSSGLLAQMQKGTTGRQNLLLLRNAWCFGIFVDWNIIWGLPGDSLSDYTVIQEILPLIRHLQPPNNFTPLLLMRFSPYLNRQREYQIQNIKPWEAFSKIYPDDADIANLATYYTGDYASEGLGNPDVIQDIFDQIELWRKVWQETQLAMTEFLGNYLIQDTRDIHPDEVKHVLQFQEAVEVMTYAEYQDTQFQKWAVKHKLGVIIDQWYVPLVTAPPQLLLEFSKKAVS